MQSLGYRRVNSALRALDHWLQTGSGDAEVLRRVQRVYGRAQEVQQARLATEQLHAQERAVAAQEAERHARVRFQPYVYVETSEPRPSFIAGAAFWACA